MNIEKSNINKVNSNDNQVKAVQKNADSDVKFADELKLIDEESVVKDSQGDIENKKNVENDVINENLQEKISLDNNFKNNKNIDEDFDIVKDVVNDLTDTVKKLNQSDDNIIDILKPNIDNDDSNKKGDNLINKDININENKEILPQMNSNMNFSGDGQPFSTFVEDNKNANKNLTLNSTADELLEEEAILSTMAENISMANKAMVREKSLEKVAKNEVVLKKNIFEQSIEEQGVNQELKLETVTRGNEVKKVDIKTNVTVENIAKFENLVMSEADVEFFSQLVQKGELDLKSFTSETVKKSVELSKTLADMLAKSMENNKPLRIDFDNNISVIIKISRDGKISADFLPSSQIAEAYLKENLPILRQKFDDNNIQYDELNQRGRKEQREQNKKKGRENE